MKTWGIERQQRGGGKPPNPRQIEHWFHMAQNNLVYQSCPRVTFLGPDPTQRNVDPTRPDPTRDYRQKFWPDPTHPPNVPCFMSSTFKLLTKNNIQLLHNFLGNSGKYFSSGLKMFPEGGKTISNGLIFKNRGLEAKKTLQISDFSKVHSRFNLSRSKLWTVFILQASSRPTRVPDQTQCIRVQYCVNFIIYQPAIVILIRDMARTDEKSLSDWTNYTITQ